MKLAILLFILAFVHHSSFGQNYIYKGRTKYKSTPEYHLSSSTGIGGQSLDVSIAKTPTGGIILLSTFTSFAEERIVGKIMLYLADGSTIVCTDKGIKDRVDDYSKALYYLTASEIKMLKQTNISKIRFSISQPGYSSPHSESFTASNANDKYMPEFPTVADKYLYNIPEDISALYE
jgi:hypothetical protein